jgi:hypothetical protein
MATTWTRLCASYVTSRRIPEIVSVPSLRCLRKGPRSMEITVSSDQPTSKVAASKYITGC